MPAPAMKIAAELRLLRKGRGVYAHDLPERVGPALREVCGIAGNDPVEMRARLIDRLGRLADTLPDDLRIAVTGSLALDPEARHHFLKDRVRWVADQLSRDDRTARRRVDEGIERIAEAAAGPPGPVPPPRSSDGWYIHRFDALLRMDRTEPEAFERRLIVAERDGLHEITVALSLPRPDGDATPSRDLLVEILYGGVRLRREAASASEFRFVMELPTTLRSGQHHEYGLRFRIPPSQPMRPHYVFVPSRRCDAFDLRVRFDRAQPPQLVWRVCEAFHRAIDDAEPTAELLVADAAGEVHAQFHGLSTARGYGVQWRPGRNTTARTTSGLGTACGSM
ncbi:MAG: hypothetical protein HYR62_06455 [Actinobacteria bacterium]|nr:hypothetical protein [Actinomycetota bacterium]